MDRRNFITASLAFLGGLSKAWAEPARPTAPHGFSYCDKVIKPSPPLGVFWPMSESPSLPVGASEPTHPRNPRVLMFTASWCKPCHDSLGNFKPYLEASGWLIGESERSHVQLIDVDKDAGAMRRWNVRTLPTFILIEDGREKRRHVGPATGRTILDLFGMLPAKIAPKPVTKTGQRMAGYHTHTCRRDGTRFGHPLFGYPVSHQCPNCGRAEYDQD